MKFKYYNKLENYIKVKNKDGFISLTEIYDGGSSYNFHLQTTQCDHFLKVIEKSSPARIRKTMAILTNLYGSQNIKEDEFTADKIAYKIITMPYIDGHKLTTRQFTLNRCLDLQTIYQNWQNLTISAEYIFPQLNIEQLSDDIEKKLQTSNDISYHLIDHLFWRRFKTQLRPLPPTTQIIHGDFTLKNILLDKTGKLHLIDFEMVRHGYATEDWAMLMLQLSGFSKLLGNRRYLKKLYEQMQNICADNEQWLYGVQLYYMERLRRRLTDVRKKHNLRKNLCFLFSLMRYFAVARLINSQ